MKFVSKKMAMVLCMLFLVLWMPGKIYGAETMQATAAAVSSNKIEIKWTAREEAKQYVVYRRSASDAEYKKMKTTSKTVYYDTDITAGMNYSYRVVPVSRANGEMIKSAQVVVKTKAPAQVDIEKITVKSPTKIQLYWKESKGSTGYQILRAKNKTGHYTEIDRVDGKTTRTYIDESVVPGKTYYYKVRPFNQHGQGMGTDSSAIKGRTIAKTNIISITSISSDCMQVQWKQIKNASSYEVYRSTSKDGGFQKVATITGAKREYKDRTVKSGKKYYYKIVVVGSLNGTRISSGFSKVEAFRVLNRVKISSVKSTVEDGLKIKWGKVAGATKYKVYRASSENGSYKKIATVKAKGGSVLSYEDARIVSGKTYYYKVQAYSDEKGLVSAGAGSKSIAMSGCTSYAIMGDTTVTTDQMVALYESYGKSFPSHIYKEKGAKDIEEFCEIIEEESEEEGVRAEVIFAQICVETGFLKFGGQVDATQCNFSGLGATDDGAAGATFPNVSTGIRAQVQHLKGYASTEDLNQPCVDPRFHFLTSKRGSVKHVQNLGNGNWATDPNYASKLMKLIKEMKTY